TEFHKCPNSSRCPGRASVSCHFSGFWAPVEPEKWQLTKVSVGCEEGADNRHQEDGDNDAERHQPQYADHAASEYGNERESWSSEDAHDQQEAKNVRDQIVRLVEPKPAV